MPADFAAILEGWHDFFLLSGTAAATLVGLLFVALSFNLDVLLHDSRTHLVSLAQQALFVFLFALFISMLYLVPGVPRRVLGVETLLFGALLTGISGRRILLVPRLVDATMSRTQILRRVVGPFIAGLLLVLAGVEILQDGTRFPSEMLPTMMLLFASGIGISWDLLVRVGRLKHGSGPRP